MKQNQFVYSKESQEQEVLEPVIPYHKKEPQLPSLPPQSVYNQALGAKDYYVDNDLRYRSVPELYIARALDRSGALFLPNCRTRLTNRNGRRVNLEPDFLVFWQNKWGILEVDGENFHPPSRTAEDYKRDRHFKRHGIQVEHYDASACLRCSDAIVADFLALLR